MGYCGCSGEWIEARWGSRICRQGLRNTRAQPVNGSSWRGLGREQWRFFVGDS